MYQIAYNYIFYCSHARATQEEEDPKKQLAIEAVTEKKMSQREVSQTFGVPQPTISDYIRHNQQINDCKPGHKLVFSQQVEAQMVKVASDAAQMGLVLSRYQFMAKAGMLHTK